MKYERRDTQAYKNFGRANSYNLDAPCKGYLSFASTHVLRVARHTYTHTGARTKNRVQSSRLLVWRVIRYRARNREERCIDVKRMSAARTDGLPIRFAGQLSARRHSTLGSARPISLSSSRWMNGFHYTALSARPISRYSRSVFIRPISIHTRSRFPFSAGYLALSLVFNPFLLALSRGFLVVLIRLTPLAGRWARCQGSARILIRYRATNSRFSNGTRICIPENHSVLLCAILAWPRADGL